MADVVQFPSTAQPSHAPGNPPLNDESARIDALDTQRSFIVEAPAGSGKTGLLVQRFLKLLAVGAENATAESGVDLPEEVLAMTFTRKATAELKERVLTELRAAHDQTPLPENASSFQHETRALALAVLARDARLGWDILHRPQRLNIRSILSVCMEIANARPLLASGTAPFRPVDAPVPLYRQAARRTLLQLGGGNGALDHSLQKILLHRDGHFLNCERLIAAMLTTREQWAELVPLAAVELTDDFLDSQVRPKLERSLEAIVCTGLTRAARAMPPGLLEELASIAARLGVHPPYKLDVSPLSLCANKNLPPEAKAEHLDHWIAILTLLLKKDGEWRKRCSRADLGFEIPKHEQTYLEQLLTSIQNDELLEALCAVRALPPAKYPGEQWAVAKSLFHVLRHALAELKVLFVERGECDYTELAVTAREVLTPGNNAVDLYLAAGGRLRHLLVDEMQDTSTGQYDLIRLLTQSWDGHSQTLFLVGDPKQSIYLFRQARVERFLRTFNEAKLGDVPLTPLRLTANFRSQQSLVNDFNRIFDLIFPRPGDPSLLASDTVDVPFVEATSTRAKTADIGIHWHASILNEETLDAAIQPTDSPSDDHIQQEAREIRRIIEQHLAAPEPPRIAVLARARNHLSAIVEELKAHDGKAEIPFRALDLDLLNERPEVQDAIALTRALLHPSDRIAWLAVLRAPWCGLSLADLLAVAGDNLDTHASIVELIHSRRSLLTTEGQRLLDRAWRSLRPAVATLGATSFATHVERTWRSLGGDAPLTSEQQTNVQRFFKLLQKLESRDGRINLAVLSEELEKLYAEPRHGDHIRVDLLTIHAAKGLEWNIVLVPGLERRPRASSGVLLNWIELDGLSPQEDGSIILAPIWGAGEDSDKLNDWLRAFRSRRERAEEKRLFYVTCTRAREELHLFAACKRNVAGSLAVPAHGTLLRACWPAAESHFTPLQNPTQQPSLVVPLARSLALEDGPFEGLVLAASASPIEHAPPAIQRLPLNFDPQERFAVPLHARLNYRPASSLPQAPSFTRPEGSFAVRAFGNVVHRYLQRLAEQLTTGLTSDQLLADLPSWQPRLLASLRAEGIPPNLAAREAVRALKALQGALTDPEGLWLLAPHTSAASEQALTAADLRSLRADRTFLAGHQPLSAGSDTLWIVDFKTAVQGSRTDEAFRSEELAKYSAQLESYASIRRDMDSAHTDIQLALYYPLIPCLLYWQAIPQAGHPV